MGRSSNSPFLPGGAVSSAQLIPCAWLDQLLRLDELPRVLSLSGFADSCLRKTSNCWFVRLRTLSAASNMLLRLISSGSAKALSTFSNHLVRSRLFMREHPSTSPISVCGVLRKTFFLSRILRGLMQWKLRLDQGPRVFAIDAAQETHHLL
jgi:hypothetical protein